MRSERWLVTRDADSPEDGMALLAAALDRAGEVCAMLERMMANPDVAAYAPTRIGLEFALKAAASVARKALAAASRAADRAAIERFVERYESFSRRWVSASTHLVDLARDWSCPACGEAVPERAGVRFLRRPPPAYHIVCRCCGDKSAPSAAGLAAFGKLFGELAATTWNPRFNDLEYDGS